jgi:hypothetical protein
VRTTTKCSSLLGKITPPIKRKTKSLQFFVILQQKINNAPSNKIPDRELKTRNDLTEVTTENKQPLL